jgi:hypothetical protein
MVLAAATVVLGVAPTAGQVVHRPLHVTRAVDAAPITVPFPIEYFGLAADLARPTDRPVENGASPYGEVRFHHAGGWEAWQPLGQDGAQEQTQFSASLMSVDHADGYQVRGLPAVFHNPRATVLNLTSGPVVASRSTLGTAAAATSSCRSRADWNADESITAWSKGTDTPQFAPDQVLTVHHTAGSNDPSQNYANTVLAIEQYHVLTNGWSDIGYQYLIDPNGVVYEGRYSGHTSTSCLTAGGDGSDFAHRTSDDAVVTGAHVGGYNTGNLGIAMLGCFDSTNPTCQPGTYGPNDTVPTPAAMTALQQLLAKLTTRHGLNPTGTTNYTNGTNTKLGVPIISGHRDWEATACPGDNVYSQLGSLRSKARTDMKPANLQATATNTTAHLGWSPGMAWPTAPSSTRYQVARQGGPTQVTCGLSFDDSGLNPGASYSYQVSALASDGSVSSDSSSTTVTTSGTPTADFGLTLTPTSAGLTAGAGTSSTVQTTQINSPSTIGLSASVSPADGAVSATVNPQSLAAGSTATVTLTTTAAAAGTYTVTITGSSSTASHSAQYSLSVANAPPTAAITPTACTGAKCSFSGSGSDPENGPTVLAWTMPNASPSAAGNVPSITVSYVSAGTFTVHLQATDPAHLTGMATATVNCNRIGKGKTKTLSCSATVP